MGCARPGLGQGSFVKRETGTVSWLHTQEAHRLLLAVGVGLSCGSPFQTLPFFLLQQARHPAPPAPCWPPCPWLPGLCSPRWTSSTCSPSTSMALPRSVSSPTSARYGLGWRAGACSHAGGGHGRWAPMGRFSEGGPNQELIFLQRPQETRCSQNRDTPRPPRPSSLGKGRRMVSPQ